jgi:cellulose biosynthesis protein BcsQ
MLSIGQGRSCEAVIYEEEGKIIFFCGSKGGCGATFAAISVSNYFASFTDKSVLFIDNNPNRDDARYIFKINDELKKTISDLDSSIDDLDLNILKKIIFNLENSLHVIIAGTKIINLDNFIKLLFFIRKYFNFIFVDFPFDLYDAADLKKFSFVDKFILVTFPEMISLINLNRMITLLDGLECSDKISLIANKCNKLMHISFLNRFIRFPVDLFLQYDRDIENLFLSGKSSMIFNYNLKTIRNLKSYCMKLCSEMAGDGLE